MKTLPNFLATTVVFTVGLAQGRDRLDVEALKKCVQMAEPLVQNPDYIFPLNIDEIRGVCRMWDSFVLCVKNYTANYLTFQQREEFELAIASSIESIRQLCDGDPEYKRLYLAYAPCMKKVSNDNEYCGGQYRYLADLVQGSQPDDAQLCCAHLKFRECVLDTTPLKCDDVSLSSADKTVTQFTREMLDRALGFLLKECKHFVPNNRDCPRSSLGVHHGNAGGANAYGNGGNEDNYNGYNDNQLHPDATTNRPSNTFPFTTSSTSRFTWTTKGIPDGVTPTADFSGNFLDGAESQQYRGAGSTFLPCLSIQVALVLSWALAVRLY
nr:uncharacterized protein LOC113820883 [Penaeus vannamei]